MMGTSHAVTGAAGWVVGWGWASVAGIADPGVDVLTVGTALCAGAALLPDFDHCDSRLARSGGVVTYGFAWAIGRIGAGIHAVTKLPADRPDRDGHRTITHTFLFALLAGILVTVACGLDTIGPVPAGKLVAALLVLAFTGLGYAAIRSAWGGRRGKVKVFGRRRHKSTVLAWMLALATFIVVPAGAWWIGLAVGVGCVIHCLGDVITESGCPVLWPIPIPRTEMRGRGRNRAPVRVWRIWFLVGTPRWMRFKVAADSAAELVIRWASVVLAAVAVAGVVWSAGWGPNA